ncbi:hypothetical protein AB3S75_029443 [Citrus x aurantiifolia]
MSFDGIVSTLIYSENNWKTKVIQQQFLKEDAYVILSIPLPRRKMKNQMILHYNKQEKYSVKLPSGSKYEIPRSS